MFKQCDNNTARYIVRRCIRTVCKGLREWFYRSSKGVLSPMSKSRRNVVAAGVLSAAMVLTPTTATQVQAQPITEAVQSHVVGVNKQVNDISLIARHKTRQIQDDINKARDNVIREATKHSVVKTAVETFAPQLMPKAPVVAKVEHQAKHVPAPAVTPQVSFGQKVVDAAMSKRGAAYVYGATGPNNFDCSGLVQWAYAQAGKSIPRISSAQIYGGTPVSLDALQPGDIVGFYNGISHVGIYIGGGQVVHSPQAGDVVKVAPLHAMPVVAAARY